MAVMNQAAPCTAVLHRSFRKFSGVSRIMVEWFGNIEEYAYYSFGIAATNLIFIFITAVSMVMYPTLKRLPEEHYGIYFIQLNQGLDIFNFTILLSYFPACWFISIFLPHYTPVLSYLNLLFAVIVLQSKISLLNNTFYKTLREEKAMLQANMGSVFFFSLLGVILFIWTRTIWSIALSMFITMLLRCYLSEFYLRQRMKVCRGKHWIAEVMLLSCFLLSTGYISNLYLSGILYGVGLLCYYFSNISNALLILKKFRYHHE